MVPHEVAVWLPMAAIIIALVGVQYSKKKWQLQSALLASIIMLALGLREAIPHDQGKGDEVRIIRVFR